MVLGLIAILALIVFLVLPLTIKWPYEIKIRTATATAPASAPPQSMPQNGSEPITTPCDVCGTDPSMAVLPECQACPIPVMNGNNGPVEVPELTGCARFVGIPSTPVKFPQTPDGTVDNPDWTVMFWVKINDMTAPEFALMQKSSSDYAASPAIVFGKGPANSNPCIKFNFTTQGSPGIMSVDPTEADVPARLAGSYSSLCPNLVPLEQGKWKFLAWTQRGPEMTFYDGDFIWMYSPNTPLKMSPGNLVFSQGPQTMNGQAAELKNVAVCNRALNEHELRRIYEREAGISKEGISSVFQRLIQVGPSGARRTPLHRRTTGRRESISPAFTSLIQVGPSGARHSDLHRRHLSTATYRKKHEGISGTFYELIEVENFSNRRRMAMMRAAAGLQRV